MSVFTHPSFWRNQLRQWHWISSALCLVGMMLFAITGFTLNHASEIEGEPKVTTVEATLPEATLPGLSGVENGQTLPTPLAVAVREATGVEVRHIKAEVSEGSVYLALPGPGVDSWIDIDPMTGDLLYERTHRGVIAVLNDLHKGRNSGGAWSLFIDIFALACVIFCVTGLGLMWLYEKGRRITWPLVGLGALVPILLFVLFVHM